MAKRDAEEEGHSADWPPGVGKTTVARAIAEDMGWNVIELNASDARNAAAIRKAPPAVQPTDPCSTTRVHHPLARSFFWTRWTTCQVVCARSVKSASSERWTAMMIAPARPFPVILGQGRAPQVARPDQTTGHSCLQRRNGLWGKNSSWRSTRDRFTKHLIKSISYEPVMRPYGALQGECFERKACNSKRRPLTPWPAPTMATCVRWFGTSRCWRRGWRRGSDTSHGSCPRRSESTDVSVESSWP